MAHEGKNYGGLFLHYGPRPTTFREYLSLQLDRPLVPGRYRLTLHLSLADYAGLATNALQVCLTERPVYQDNTLPMAAPAPLVPLLDGPLTNKRTWRQISVTLMARGGERHLLLGNFLPPDSTLLLPVPVLDLNPGSAFNELAKSAYYYVDDVQLLADPLPEILYTLTDVPLQQGIYVLPTVQFEFDKAVLTPESLPALAELATYLRQNPHYRLTVRGHTDDVGTASYNLALSQRRAQAVLDYLQQKGIAANRLAAVGLGSSQPLIHGQDEAARQRNRRVEVQLQE